MIWLHPPNPNMYSLVWGQCTEFTQTRLQQQPGFKLISQSQDAIALLSLIRDLIFRLDNKQHPVLSMVNNDLRVFRFIQGRDVSVSLFHKQFKSLVQVIEKFGGFIGAHDNLIKRDLKELDTSIDPNDPTTYSLDQWIAAAAIAKEKYLALLFLRLADQSRYGDLVDGLIHDHHKGLDTLPKTLQAAFTLLTESKPSRPTSAVVSGSSFVQGKGPSCWGCGEPGVVLSECSNSKCIEKWKAKQEKRKVAGTDEGVRTAGQSHLNVDWDQAEDYDLTQFHSFSMNQVHHQQKVPARYILLNSESTHCTFYTRQYLKNIRTTEHPIDVHTNGGVMKCVLEGDLPGFGPVYYNPHGIANILSFAAVEASRRRITYDLWAGGMFHVHNPKNTKVIDFYKLPSGLYVHDVKQTWTQALTFVETVEENKKLFSSRQYLRAKQAREFYAMLGVPSIADYASAIKNKLIPNAPITVDDIKNAEIIFGKDLGAIQGKTTRGKPAPVVPDYIAQSGSLLCSSWRRVRRLPWTCRPISRLVRHPISYGLFPPNVHLGMPQGCQQQQHLFLPLPPARQ